MKVEIQETDLSYIVQLTGPTGYLGQAFPKSLIAKAEDPRAFLADELDELFVEWGIAHLLPSDTKDRLIQEFFTT